MKKKVTFAIAAIIAAALLLCGLNAFAFASTGSSAVSDSLQGTLKSVSADKTELTITTAQGDQTVPVAKSVWVYRNEMKGELSALEFGDRVDVILNSKHQAAYIKADAASQQQAAAAPSAAPTAAPTATPSPQPVSPKPTPSNAKPAAPTAYPGLDGLQLKINGQHFLLELKQNPGNDGTKYELNIKPDHGGTIHLKGDAAAQWIAELLANVDLKSGDARQSLLQQIAGHYGLDAGKLNIQLKTDWSAAVQKADDDRDAPSLGHSGDKGVDQAKHAPGKPKPEKQHGRHDEGHDEGHGEGR